MPIDPRLFNALGAGQAAQVPQPGSPAPSGSPDSGAGSIFQALAQQPMNQMAPQQAQLGPLVAANDTGLMKGNPFFVGNTDESLNKTPPPPPSKPKADTASSDHDLAKTATNFFNRMKQ